MAVQKGNHVRYRGRDAKVMRLYPEDVVDLHIGSGLIVRMVHPANYVYTEPPPPPPKRRASTAKAGRKAGTGGKK